MTLTPEQLKALPEFNDTYTTTDDKGHTVLHYVVPKFSQYAMQPDDVIMFRDGNETWVVDYHLEGGPYKRRFYL